MTRALARSLDDLGALLPGLARGPAPARPADTNRVIREAFVEAGYQAPEQRVAVHNA